MSFENKSKCAAVVLSEVLVAATYARVLATHSKNGVVIVLTFDFNKWKQRI